MKLIHEWKKAYRLQSVQAMSLLLAIQAAWPQIPDDIKAELPAHLMHWISVAMLIAGIVLRVVQQPSLTEKPPEAEKP